MAKTVVKGISKSEGIVRIPYQEGNYKFLVKTAEEGESKAGDPLFSILCEIQEAPKQDSGRDVTGRPYRDVFVVIPDHEARDFMVDKLKDFLKAAQVRVGADDTFDFTKAEGKVVCGRMIHSIDARDGTKQSRISKWYSPEEFEAMRADRDEEDD